MGGKYGRQRQHISLYIACLLFGLSLSCHTPVKNFTDGPPHLKIADDQIRKANFKSALIENQQAIDDPAQTQMDTKIFQRGLIYGHPENPERNLTESRKYFQHLIEYYPESLLVTTAKIMILYIDKTEETEKTLKKQKNQNKAYRSEAKKMEILQRDQALELSELKSQIELLKEQIESYKAIDLNIEKQKKVDIVP